MDSEDEEFGLTRCFPSDPYEVNMELLLDTLLGEEAITSACDFMDCMKTWQARRVKTGASFLVLHCTVLGREAQMLRQKFSLKRNTNVHVVYSDVRDGMGIAGSGINLQISPFKDTWKWVMKENVKTTNEPTVLFFGNALVNYLDLQDLTLNDVLMMYTPSIFVESYSHSLSALINSLHTFLPLLEDGTERSSCGSKVKAPAPTCCLENAVAHSQRKVTSPRDQALYDSANLVASQLYEGVTVYFGPQLCYDFEQRACFAEELRIGLEGATVPFHDLYIARGGDVRLQRGLRENSGFEIVCWTAYGSPEGGEFVIPGLMYKFATRQSSTILFRPNRFYHATLPPEKRDSTNEKFAVALLS